MKVERSEVVLRLSKNEAADMRQVMVTARRVLADVLEARRQDKKKPEASTTRGMHTRDLEEQVAFLYWLERALRGVTMVPVAKGMHNSASFAFSAAMQAVKDECSEEEDSDAQKVFQDLDTADNKLHRDVLNLSGSCLPACKCDCCDEVAVSMIRGLGVFCRKHGNEALDKDRIVRALQKDRTMQQARAAAAAEAEDCATHNAPTPVQNFAESFNAALRASVPKCCVCWRSMISSPSAARLTIVRGDWYCEQHDGSTAQEEVPAQAPAQRMGEEVHVQRKLNADMGYDEPVKVEYPFILNAGDRVCVTGGAWGEYVGYTPMAVESQNELLLLWRVGWTLPVDRRQVIKRYEDNKAFLAARFRLDERVVRARWFTLGEPDAQNFVKVVPWIDAQCARDLFTSMLTGLDRRLTADAAMNPKAAPTLSTLLLKAQQSIEDAGSPAVALSPSDFLLHLETAATYMLWAYSTAQKGTSCSV